MNNNKIQAFKDILYYLNKWYKEENPDKESNDLSILKVMKLLFFVAGVDKENHLFDIFNNFQAWQYGHVEADVYDDYSKHKGNLGEIQINRVNLTIDDSFEPSGKYSNAKNNINKLKEINKNLISYDAFKLVDISHSYSSWDIYYNKLNKRYEVIEPEILRYEPKYYN
ncbi:MAG: DUF4065 domain-containing protein [Bergeyella zoohelcum]|nr:DUF4065 domain-containing protein [Bergeyella zoohelcum]